MSSRTPLSTKEVATSVHDELRNKTNSILNEGDSLIDQENRSVRERINNVQKTADSKFNDINAKGKLADIKINEAQELQSRAADKLFQAKELAREAPSHITSPTRTSAQTTYSNSNSALSSSPYYKSNQDIDNRSGGGMFSSIKGAFVGIKNDIASVFSSSSSSSTSAPSTSSNNYSTSSSTSHMSPTGAPLSHTSPPTTSASLVEGHKLAEGLAFPFNRAPLDEQSSPASSSTSLPSSSTLSKLERSLENAEQSVMSSAKKAEQKFERVEKRAEEKLRATEKKVEEKYRAAEQKAEIEAEKAKQAGENFASGIKDAFVGIKNDIASVFSSSSSSSSTPSLSTSSSSANTTTHPMSDGIAFPFNRVSDDRSIHTSIHEKYTPFIAPEEHIVQKYVPPQAALVQQPLYEEIDLNSPSTLHALHTSTGKLAVNDVSSERSLIGEIKQRVHDIKDDFMRDSMMNDRARLMIDDDINSQRSAPSA